MHTNRIQHAFLAFGIVLALITAAGLLGCSKLQELDAAIWTPGTQTPEQIAAGKAPPILEAVATALALAGYGGMAAWVRRNNKRGHADLDNVRNALSLDATTNANLFADLSARLARLENKQ